MEGEHRMMKTIGGMFKRTPGGEAGPAGWEGAARRPRVLVEGADFAERWAIGEELGGAGFGVVTCGGPGVLASGACSLVVDGSCAAAAGADVIFHRLDPDDTRSAGVLTALKQAYPATPIVVEIAGPHAQRHQELLAGCRVLPRPASPEAMVTAIQEAGGTGPGPD
jgi:hypothetical protein